MKLMEAKINGSLPGIPFGIFPSREIAETALQNSILPASVIGWDDQMGVYPLTMVSAQVSMLTPRERQVANLVIKGFSTKVIAGMLGISQSTVQKHREHINWKTGTKNAVQLLHWMID